MFLCFVEELLVLFEAAAATLGLVEVGPHSGEEIRRAEDQEQPVVEIVKHDRREQSHGKVGNAPDDNANGCALSTSGRGKDLGRDELN